MTEEALVFLLVDCPGCKRKHDISVRREWLREELERGGEVKLYCISSNATWPISEQEKSNTREAFGNGTL